MSNKEWEDYEAEKRAKLEKIKIPQKYEYLKDLIHSRTMGQIAHFVQRDIYSDGVTVRNKAPIIAVIYLLNNMEHEYKTIRKYADKNYGKQSTASIIFNFVVENDMGVTLAEKMWKDRNTRTSKEFYEIIGNAKEEYLDMILSTPKFYKQFDEDSSRKTWIDYIFNASNLMKRGKEYPKFVKFTIRIADTFNDERFLPKEAVEIFMF